MWPTDMDVWKIYCYCGGDGSGGCVCDQIDGI